MTVIAAVHDAIHEAVFAFAATNGVACAYPNAAFTPPRDPDHPLWMRLAILGGELAQEQLYAASRPTYRGAFVLSMFAPYDTGSAALTELVDEACTAFGAGTAIGDAVVLRASVQAVPGPDNWAQTNLTVFFRARE